VSEEHPSEGTLLSQNREKTVRSVRCSDFSRLLLCCIFQLCLLLLVLLLLLMLMLQSA
jgi:hypothetical protein